MPVTFPDASIGGKSTQKENLFDIIFSAKNVNEALKSGVSAGLKLVPECGALLSGLVSALWPNPEVDKGLVWKDIESKVEGVASGLINKNNSKQMRSQTEGLYNVMEAYLRQAPGTAEKGQYFTNMMTSLLLYQPYFFNDEAPWDNLAYFVSVGTLHLTVLREQHLFYSKIYGHEDSQTTQHQQDLEEKVKKYLTARNKAVAKCIEWHKTQIAENWHKKNNGYWNTCELNYVNAARQTDQYFEWRDDHLLGKLEYKCRSKQFEDWIHTGYRA